jgi:hypothetical protein
LKKILLLGGTIPPDIIDLERARAFSKHLGRLIGQESHIVLYNGNADNLASYAVDSMAEEIEDLETIRRRIITYMPRSRISHDPYDDRPVHIVGRQIIVGEWAEERRERMVQDCDIVVSYSGRRGTIHSLSLSAFYQKPVIPIPQFGGSTQKYFESHLAELQKFMDYGIDIMILQDYSILPEKLAREVVRTIDVYTDMFTGKPWVDELRKIARGFDSEAGNPGLGKIRKELDRIQGGADPVTVLTTSRRILEHITMNVVECTMGEKRGTAPLKGVIERLRKKAPIPETVISHMFAICDLGKYGSHPILAEGEDEEPILSSCIIHLSALLDWYVKDSKM